MLYEMLHKWVIHNFRNRSIARVSSIVPTLLLEFSFCLLFYFAFILLWLVIEISDIEPSYSVESSGF